MGKTNTDCFPPWVYNSGLLLFRAFEKCKAGSSVPKEEHRLYMAMQMSLVTRGISGRAFHEQRLSKSRAELGKSKFPEVSLHTIYYWRTPYLFFHGTQKAITTSPINLLVESKMVRRFLRFGFARGSSGSRFLWFVGCLIFCGSVRRFRFGSWTLLNMV